VAPAVRPGHHVAPDGVVEGGRWQRVDDRGRHQERPGGIVGVEEVAHGNRDGRLALVVEQQEGVEVLVPGEEQSVGADRDHRRAHQRQIDQPVELHRRRTVDPGRLVELEGDGVAVLAKDPDGIGRGEGRHGEGERPEAVQQAVVGHHPIERDREEGHRDQVGQERRVRDEVAEARLEPADGEAGEARDREHDRHGGQGHEQAVAELPPEGAQEIVLLEQHRLVVLQRRPLRPEPPGEGVGQGRDRDDRHVVDRQERPDQDDDAEGDEEALLQHPAERMAEAVDQRSLAGEGGYGGPALAARRHHSTLRPSRLTRMMTRGTRNGSAVITEATPMSSSCRRKA
jgi:hypothetical protein